MHMVLRGLERCSKYVYKMLQGVNMSIFVWYGNPKVCGYCGERKYFTRIQWIIGSDSTIVYEMIEDKHEECQRMIDVSEVVIYTSMYRRSTWKGSGSLSELTI